MSKLKVCLVVDVEGFISFKRWNPEWTLWQNLKLMINGLLAPLKYDKEGYEKIYDLVYRYKFPVSFMLVGSLFKPKAKQKFIDYGYHSFSHKPLTYLSDEQVEKEIKNIYNAVSFSAPMNLIDDPFQPRRILRMLKEEGYNICIWAGPTIRDKKKNIVIVPPRRKILKAVKIEEIKCVYISDSFDGKMSTERIKSIIKEIDANSKKDAVYCLTTHDFANKNLKNLRIVISALSKMREKRLIKLTNLGEIASSK